MVFIPLHLCTCRTTKQFQTGLCRNLRTSSDMKSAKAGVFYTSLLPMRGLTIDWDGVQQLRRDGQGAGQEKQPLQGFLPAARVHSRAWGLRPDAFFRPRCQREKGLHWDILLRTRASDGC